MRHHEHEFDVRGRSDDDQSAHIINDGIFSMEIALENQIPPTMEGSGSWRAICCAALRTSACRWWG
jgi:hypothetical protein